MGGALAGAAVGRGAAFVARADVVSRRSRYARTSSLRSRPPFPDAAIAADSAGTLHVLRQEGDTVNVGDVVGSIDDGLSTAAPRVRLATDVDGGESPSAAPARAAATMARSKRWRGR